jgi:hypothetical protein
MNPNKKLPDFAEAFDDLYEEIDLYELDEVKNVELKEYYDNFSESLEKDLTEILK